MQILPVPVPGPDRVWEMRLSHSPCRSRRSKSASYIAQPAWIIALAIAACHVIACFLAWKEPFQVPIASAGTAEPRRHVHGGCNLLF